MARRPSRRSAVTTHEQSPSAQPPSAVRTHEQPRSNPRTKPTVRPPACTRQPSLTRADPGASGKRSKRAPRPPRTDNEDFSLHVRDAGRAIFVATGHQSTTPESPPVAWPMACRWRRSTRRTARLSESQACRTGGAFHPRCQVLGVATLPREMVKPLIVVEHEVRHHTIPWLTAMT
jgi:hypothetical protein